MKEVIVPKASAGQKAEKFVKKYLSEAPLGYIYKAFRKKDIKVNGHIAFEGNFPDQSKDAYKLAFDLWGCADEYLWDEKKGKYVYKDQPIMSAGPAPVMG